MNLTWALSYTLVSVVTASIIFLIYNHSDYNMGSRKEIDSFHRFLIAFLCFVLCNGVCIWANCYSLSVLGTIFTCLSLVGICSTAFFWFYYIEVRLKSSRVEKSSARIMMMAPMLIVVLLIITSPLTHLVFYYDGNGDYCRGVLYPIILIAALLYLVTASIQTYRKLVSARTKSQKRQYHYLMIFIIFPCIAGLIDFIYAHLPSMEMVVAFGIILIYLSMQDDQIYRDGLTGLNNRKLTDEYMQESIAFASEENPIHFFLGDIDHFKRINDRFGHLEGDRALKLVAGVLKKYDDSDHCYVSRWGGDEIVIIADGQKGFDPEEFKKSIADDIRRATSDSGVGYDISLSIGHVRCADPDMEVDRIIMLADQRMYAEKTQKE